MPWVCARLRRAARAARTCTPRGWRCAATLTSLQPHARFQVCRVSAVTAGLVYGAVKSTYLQTFKARLTARGVDPAQPHRATPILTLLLSPHPRKHTGTTEETAGW